MESRSKMISRAAMVTVVRPWRARKLKNLVWRWRVIGDGKGRFWAARYSTCHSLIDVYEAASPSTELSSSFTVHTQIA